MCRLLIDHDKSGFYLRKNIPLMHEILPDINALGFDVQEFGKDTFVIHGLPADVEGDEKEMMENLLENYKNNLSVLKLEKRESLARSLAQQTAIKAGRSLSAKEMQTLIDELFACEQPFVSPSKRNTFVTFDFDELEKRFAGTRDKGQGTRNFEV